MILFHSSSNATIIDIPDDYPTIQQGIDASTDGDTVLVQPGTYEENINFNGHNIVLGSLFVTTGDTSFTSLTVIDGSYAFSAVRFENGENGNAKLIGLTLLASEYSGFNIGIFCENAHPTISNNIIRDFYVFGPGPVYCPNCPPGDSEKTAPGGRPPRLIAKTVRATSADDQ